MLLKSLRKFLPEILPIGMLFLLVTVFFFPVLFQGQTFIGSGLIYSDLMTLNYPLKELLAQSLREGSLPFWTTLIGNGTPILAESQIGALYPFHLLLFRFLPTMTAFNLNLFLHFMLAALGTYLFTRISLKLSPFACVLGALAFTFSGFMITRIHQTNIVLVVSWLPIIFLLIERIVTRQKILFAFFLALAFAFQILAGYFEMFYYSLLGGALFALLLLLSHPSTRSGQGKSVLLLVFSLILALGLTAPQTLSTWEMTKYSIRSQGLTIESAASDTWPLQTFAYFINPRAWDIYTPNQSYKPSDETTVSLRDLYGYIGFIPLVLAFSAVFFLFKKKSVMIFLILLFSALILSLGRSTQLFTIFWDTIPGIKFFRFPTKWLFFIEFTLAVLAAHGFEEVLKKVSKVSQVPKVSQGVVGWLVGGAILLIVFADLYFNNRPLQLRADSNFIEAPKVVGEIKKGLSEGNYRFYSHGTNNMDPATMKDGDLQKEFMNILPPDTNILYGLPSNREWYTLFLTRQRELTRLNTRLDPETGVLSIPPEMKKSLDLQGVKYLLSDLEINDQGLVLVKELPLSKQVNHLAYMMNGPEMRTARIPVEKTYVYENEDVIPRAFWVDKARVMKGKTEDQMLATVLGDDLDLRSEVILEEKPVDISQMEGEGQGKAEITNYKEQSVGIETSSQKPGFLVLTDTYYPGWKATLWKMENGEWRMENNELKIYRGDFAFRAVQVPGGKHLIKFTFEPTYWKLGLWVSGGTLLVVLLGLGWSLWKKV
ncbi:MAG: YfhO family protein [bacterium]|nr:YfhO family protein [bacterium]